MWPRAGRGWAGPPVRAGPGRINKWGPPESEKQCSARYSLRRHFGSRSRAEGLFLPPTLLSPAGGVPFVGPWVKRGPWEYGDTFCCEIPGVCRGQSPKPDRRKQPDSRLCCSREVLRATGLCKNRAPDKSTNKTSTYTHTCIWCLV